MKHCELLTEALEGSFEVFKALIEFVHGASELALVEFDLGLAVSADEPVVRLDPSERLLRLLAALRAWKVQVGVIEHGSFSSCDGASSASPSA